MEGLWTILKWKNRKVMKQLISSPISTILLRFMHRRKMISQRSKNRSLAILRIQMRRFMRFLEQDLKSLLCLPEEFRDLAQDIARALRTRSRVFRSVTDISCLLNRKVGTPL